MSWRMSGKVCSEGGWAVFSRGSVYSPHSSCVMKSDHSFDNYDLKVPGMGRTPGSHWLPTRLHCLCFNSVRRKGIT